MATALKLKNDINKLKAALRSKATPKSFIPKLKSQLEKAEADYESVKAGKKSAPKAGKQVKSTMDKLKAIIKKKKYGAYRAQGVDLEKDAKKPALPTGKRISKNGNTYYEYRANRIDVKQPPKRYPKLEKGGMMAKGGSIKDKRERVIDYYLNNDVFDDYDTYGLTEQDLMDAKKSKSYKKIEDAIVKYHGLDDDENVEERFEALGLEDDEYAKGGYMADGGMTPLDVSNQIYDITVRIAELGDINTEAAYEETKNLMKMRAALQARALHLQDMEMAKDGMLLSKNEEKQIRDCLIKNGFTKDIIIRKESWWKNKKIPYWRVYAVKSDSNEKYEYINEEIGIKVSAKDICEDIEIYVKYGKMEKGGYMEDGGVIYLKSVGTYFRPSDLATSSEESFSNEGEIVDLADIDNEEWFNALSEKDRATIEKYKAKGGMMAKGGDLSSIKKKYEENEDENAHSENVVLLAKHFGTKEDLAKAKEILALHEKEGSLSSENGKKRQELHLKLIGKAKAEMGKQGIEFEKGGYMAKGGATKKYYHILEYHNYGDIGYQGYYDTKEEATKEADRLSKLFPNLDYQVWESDKKTEPPITTLAKGGYMAHGGKLEVGDEGMYEGGEAVILTIDDKSYAYSYLDEDGKPKSQKMFAAKSKFENQFRVFPKYAGGGELHRSQEKYAYGRYMAMGGAIEHGLKKGDHIMVVRGNMLGIKNEITGEIVTLNIETGERKESKE